MTLLVIAKVICLMTFVLVSLALLTRESSKKETLTIIKPEVEPRAVKWKRNETVIAAYLAIYGVYKVDELTSTLATAIGRKSSSLNSKAMKLRAGSKGQRKWSPEEADIYNDMRRKSKWLAELTVVDMVAAITKHSGNWLYEEGYFVNLK